MNNVAGVNFKENGKIYFFKANDISVNDGDYVIVETDKGLQFGKVIVSNIKSTENTEDMKNIIRVATKEDINTYESNKKDAQQALLQGKKIAKKLNLKMNIIEANYTFDRKQLMFLFLSDGRVDFREMAKELAYIYKTRIELRQIGVRDKAREVSGIGSCGRALCCSSFLKNSMESVSINMAKNQNLALNPSKINGQCGRLLCCLNYEDEVYSEYRKGMPNIGDEVKTDKGTGTVTSIDVLKKKYTVDIENEGRIEVSIN